MSLLIDTNRLPKTGILNITEVGVDSLVISNNLNITNGGNNVIINTTNNESFIIENALTSYTNKIVRLPSTTGDSVFTIMYDSDGKAQWANNIDGTGSDQGNSIAMDTDMNTYVIGKYNSSTNVTVYDDSYNNSASNVLLPSTTNDSTFITKYNSEGIAQWATTIDGTGADAGRSIAINGSNVYVTGVYYSTTSVPIYDSGFNDIKLPVTTSEAIFTIKYDTDGKVKWATSIDGSGADEEGRGVVMDANGNTYVTGWYNNANTNIIIKDADGLQRNNISLSVTDSIAGFIVKYDTNGIALWAAEIYGLTGTDQGYSIALDDDGYIYVTGQYDNEITLTDAGNTTISSSNIVLKYASGNQATFVAKYNSEGIAQWATTIDGTSADSGRGIAVHGSNVYVTGYYNSTSEVIIYDAGQVLPKTTSEAIFTVKYDTDGKIKWATNIDGTGADEEGRGVTMDADGNTYVTGWYSSSSVVTISDAHSIFSTSNVTLPIASTISAFLVKYDTNGISQWATSINGTGTDQGYGISLDNNSNVYIHGLYNSTTSITLYDRNDITTSTNNITLPNNSRTNSFIAKYNNDGIAQWATVIDSGGSTINYLGIANDNSNNIYVTGTYSSTGSINIYDSDDTNNSISLPNTISTSEAIFTVKYGTDGKVKWATTIDGTGADEEGRGVAMDANSNTYVTGWYSSTSEVTVSDAGSIYSTSNVILPISSSISAFLVKYDTNGIAQWVTTINGTGTDKGHCIAIDSSNNTYISGEYVSTAATTLYDADGGTVNNVSLPISTTAYKFIAKYNSEGITQWATLIANINTEWGMGEIAIDNNDNVYSTGWYIGGTSGIIYNADNSIYIPPTTNEAIFTIKYDTDGKVKWATTIDGTGTDEEGRGIVMDADGNTYVTGWYSSSSVVTVTDAGSTSSTSNVTLPIASTISAFLVKYDTNGISQWTTTIDGTGTDGGYGISLDSSSNIYITGQYDSTTTIILYDADGSNENNIVLPISSGTDSFIAKYNNNGVAQWATVIQGTSTDSGQGITVDNSNNVYATGYYNSTGSVNIYDSDDTNNSISLPNTISTSEAIFTIKYDTDGKVKWTASIDGTGADEEGRGVTMDADGNTYVTGWYSSSSVVTVTDAGSTSSTSNVTLPIASTISAFLVKYDTNGISQWTTTIDGTGTDRGFAISLDSSSNIYIHSTYNSTETISLYDANGETTSNIVLPISTGQDSFIVKYNNDGIAQWATVQQSTGSITSSGITIDNNNNIYISGYYPSYSLNIYNNTNDINNPISLRAPTLYGTYLIKYNSSGIAQWATSIDSTGEDICEGVITDSYGDVYIVGRYDGSQSGTIYNAGEQVSTITLPDNDTGWDLFIVKFNSLGTALWANKIGGSITGNYFDQGYDITIDSENNIYITGVIYRVVDINIYKPITSGNTITVDFNIIRYNTNTNTDHACILVKYNSVGEAQWASIIDGTVINNGEGGYGVAVDSDDNIYITGQYGTANGANIYLKTDTTNSGQELINSGLSLPVGSGTTGAFVVKYDTNGNPIWATTIDGTGADLGYGIAAMGSEIAVTGTYVSTNSVPIRRANSIYLRTPTTEAMYLVKYNSDGIAQWVTSIDTANTIPTHIARGQSITVDNYGNVYIIGNHNTGVTTIYNAGNQQSAIVLDATSTGIDTIIIKFNSEGTVQWANKINGDEPVGTYYSEYGFGIVTDSENYVYITGIVDRGVNTKIYNPITSGNTFTSHFDIRRYNTTTDTGFACILVKYNSDGEAQWATVIDGIVNNDNEAGYGVAVDSDDNIYLTGKYGTANGATIYNAINSSDTSPIYSGLSLPVGSVTTGTFVVKYNPSGIAQWATTIDGTGADIGYGIAAMGSEIAVTGTYTSTNSVYVRSAYNVMLRSATYNGGYLIKYNSSGIAQWAATIDGGGYDESYGVTTDNLGNVYITGKYDANVTAVVYNANQTSTITLPDNDTYHDIFIVKFNSDGEAQWANKIRGGATGNYHDYPWSIASDSGNNVYLTGYVDRIIGIKIFNTDLTTFAFNSEIPDPGDSGYAAILVKYNSSGTPQWVSIIDNSYVLNESESGFGVTVDSNDYIYITGRYGTVNGATIYNAFDSTSTSLSDSGLSLPVGSGTYGAFVVKYNSFGIAQWATIIDGTGNDTGYGIASMGSEIVVTGVYVSSSSVPIRRANSVYLNSAANGYSIYLVKYNSDGIAQWAVNTTSSSGNEFGFNIAIDSLDNIYISGLSDDLITLNNADGSVANFTIPDSSSSCGCIIKYDSTGTAQWATRFEGTISERAYAISIDNNNNVYVSGNAFRANPINIYNTENTSVFTILNSGNTGLASILLKYDSSGTPQWATVIDGIVYNDNEAVYGVAVDSDDNIYVTGNYGTVNGANIYLKTDTTNSGQALINSGLTLPIGSGTTGTFVVKYNSSGIAQWATTIDGTGNDVGYGIAAMGSEIAVTGTYTSTSSVIVNSVYSITLRTPTSDAIYLVKYNSDGIAQWAASVDSSGGDNGYGITTDSLGNIYIIGRYDGGQLGSVYNAGNLASSITLPDNDTSWDVFIVKYNSNGEAQWANRIRANVSNWDFGYSITTDSENNVYVTGFVDRASNTNIYNTDMTTLAFAISNNSIDSGAGIFLVKYNSYGTPQWGTIIDGTVHNDSEWECSVTVDSDDNIYLTGKYGTANGATIYNAINSSTSPIDSGLSLPIGSGTTGTFVVKYNPYGIAQWATIIDGTGADLGYGIVAMGSEIAVTGTYTSTSSVSIRNAYNVMLRTPSPTNKSAAYLVKYNTSGVAQWAATIDGAGDEYGLGITTDSLGYVYITGLYNADVTATIYNANQSSTITLPDNDTGSDIYIIKYNSDGEAQWANKINGSATGSLYLDEGYSIATDSENNVYVTGLVDRITTIQIYNTDMITLAFTISNNSRDTGFACILVKYNSSGTPQWGTIIDANINSDTEVGRGVTVDSDDNIYITGQYNSTLPIPIIDATSSSNLPTTTIGSSVFTIKYDIDGNVKWATNFANETGSLTQQTATSMTVSGLGTSANPFTATSTNTAHSSTGSVTWTVQGNGILYWKISVSSEASYDFARLYVNGVQKSAISGITNTSGSTVVTTGNSVEFKYTKDVSASLYSDKGYLDYLYILNNDATGEGRGVAMDADGNTYVTGWYSSSSVVTLTDAGSTSSTNNVTLHSVSSSSVFLVKYDTNGVSQWAVSVDGTGSDKGYSVAVDAAGNVYLSGLYGSGATTIYNANNVSSGKTLRATSGDTAAFVVKYNSSGILDWFVSVDSAYTDQVRGGVEVDAAGNVYFAGYYSYGGSSSATIYNTNNVSSGLTLRNNGIFTATAFAVKYNSSGQAQWAVSVDGGGDKVGLYLAVDANGNVYLSGYNYGPISYIYNANNEISNLTLKASDGGYSAFLVKYNSSGIAQWVVSVDSPSSDLGYGVEVDSSGNVYLAGAYAGVGNIYNANNEISNLTLRTTSGYAAYVVKYNSSGIAQWAVSCDSAGTDETWSVAVDADSNLYLCGKYDSTSATIYNANNTSSGLSLPVGSGTTCAFVVKYNSDGLAQWATTIDGTGADIGYGIAAMGSEIAVTGTSTSSSVVRIDRAYTRKTSLLASSGNATFIVKYNSYGVTQWAASIDGSSYDIGYGIATDGSNIYVTGSYNSSANIYNYDGISGSNNVALPITTTDTQYIVKYNSDGEAQWASILNGTGADSGLGITAYGNRIAYTGKYNSSSHLIVPHAHNISLHSTTSEAIFTIKYDTDGKVKWTASIDGTGTDIGHAIAMDSDGNTYITGRYNSTTSVIIKDANSTSSTNNVRLNPTGGYTNVFVVKYDTNGIAQWATKIYVSPNTLHKYDITVDSENNIYIVGNYINASTSNIYDAGTNQQQTNGVTIPTNVTENILLIKYNSSGIAQWAATIPGTSVSSYGTGFGVTTDSDDNVIICGYIYRSSSVNIYDAGGITRTNSVSLPSFNSSGGIIVKYDKNGIVQWRVAYDADFFDNAISITTYNNNIYVTGYYNNNTATPTIYNGNGTTTTLPKDLGSTAAVILAINSSGITQWRGRIDNAGFNTGLSIATDSSGNIYVSGISDRLYPIYIYDTTNLTSIVLTVIDPGDTGYASILVKYDSSGVPQWATIIDGTANNDAEAGFGVTVDSDDNIYVTGKYGTANGANIYLKTDTTNSGQALINSGLSLPVGSGTTGAFVVKYNSDGLAQWATTIDGTGDDIGYGIAAMGSEIAVTGTYTSTVDIPILNANKNETLDINSIIRTHQSGDAGLILEKKIKENNSSDENAYGWKVENTTLLSDTSKHNFTISYNKNYNNYKDIFATYLTISQTGAITYPGTLTDVSDARYKFNIEDVNNAIDIIRKIHIQKYDKTLNILPDDCIDISDNIHHTEFGVIAQELIQIPELAFIVKQPNDPSEPYSVNYHSLFAVVIKALQETYKKLQKTKSELNEIKTLLQSEYPGEI